MQRICQKNKHWCKRFGENASQCELCYKDKVHANLGFEYSCLMQTRKRYENLYKMHMDSGKKEEAINVAKEYAMLEQKILGKEQE